MEELRELPLPAPGRTPTARGWCILKVTECRLTAAPKDTEGARLLGNREEYLLKNAKEEYFLQDIEECLLQDTKEEYLLQDTEEEHSLKYTKGEYLLQDMAREYPHEDTGKECLLKDLPRNPDYLPLGLRGKGGTLTLRDLPRNTLPTARRQTAQEVHRDSVFTRAAAATATAPWSATTAFGELAAVPMVVVVVVRTLMGIEAVILSATAAVQETVRGTETRHPLKDAPLKVRGLTAHCVLCVS